MPADGYADHGCVLVLTNDRSYWQPTARADTIDAQFRPHEGRVLEGTLRWADRAGTGTTARRDTPLTLCTDQLRLCAPARWFPAVLAAMLNPCQL
jgi:hypothetical protein